MIKVVIIEDEAPARKKLKKHLERIDQSVSIVKEIETVEETKSFFESSCKIDLIFSDIELRDGNVFEAFEQQEVLVPIIFSTAYDQFWMSAFETNGIEYLLKPYSFSRFEKAWNKYILMKNSFTNNQDDIIKKLDTYYRNQQESKPIYKEYIPVKSKSSIYFLKVEDITIIKADYGVVFAFDSSNKKHTLNQNSLKEIQDLFNPTIFFKINRSELVNRHYIEKIERYTKNTIAIHIKKHCLKTSQATTAAFNSWIGL